MSVLTCDIEIYHGFFYVGFKRLSDGFRLGFELSKRSPVLDTERLKKIMMSNQIVTFNGNGYDVPLIFYAINGATNAELKEKSDAIIQGRVPYWKVEDLLGIRVPRACDHIDLIEPQPNAVAGLKILNGRLHGKRMQDLPFDVTLWPNDDEKDVLADYCLTSDLDATDNLFGALKEPLQLRVALGEEYGMDFRSKSDSQIGEAIVKKRVEALTGEKIQRVPTAPGTTFKYPVPAFLKFESPQMQEILERVRDTNFVVQDNGKVDLPKWLNDAKIRIGSSVYSMGIGGLHSTEKNRAVLADDDYALVDADVASQYPAIILALGLFPKALGKHFLTVYRKIKDDRLAAKKRAKAIKIELAAGGMTETVRAKLEVELFACTVKDKGLKIALNGVYGKLGSRYSVLYAPHLLISTTLTGQLTLLMLIERAVAAGIDVVSGNTDGVLFKVPRDWYDGLDGDRLQPSYLADVTSQWEADTGFDLEFAEYDGIYNRSVNDYIAIKTGGGHKRKGVFGNPWSKDKSDYDPRAILMKNPNATVVSDAVLALITKGTPVEETIYNCTDFRQFVSVIKVDGGCTWRGEYLGKVARFYWTTDGDEILTVKSHHSTGSHRKIPKSDGCAPAMLLPDELPDDLDYARYIAEANEAMMAIGAAYRPPPPPKMVRFTKANTVPLLCAWAMIDL